MVYVFPVAKCPFELRSRFGRAHNHDWYQALLEAVVLLNGFLMQGLEARILIVTGFKLADQPSEALLYKNALALLGVHDPVILEDGYHTGDQVRIAEEYAEKAGAILVGISTAFHFWHFSYYANFSTHCLFAWGVPSLWECPKDLCMPAFAWLVDCLGIRSTFEQWVRKRRVAGVL